MKITRIMYLALTIFFTGNLFAQNSTNSLLWEISGNGLNTPSYLFGTIHTIPKKDFFFTDKMRTNFDKCKIFVTEISLDIPLSMQLELAHRTLIADKKTLTDFITPKQNKQIYAYLSDTLKFNDSKIDRLLKLKPLFLQAYIMMKQTKRHVEYETKLHKLAKKNKMEHRALEKIEYQMDVIDKIPMEVQIASMLHEGTDFYGLLLEKEFTNLVKLYKQQDIQALYKQSNEDAEFKKYEDILLTDRNINWIPHLKKIVHEASAFIAVGAGHLAGTKGVIQLLRNEGYTVKAVY